MSERSRSIKVRVSDVKYRELGKRADARAMRKS